MNSEAHDLPKKERYSFTLPPELVNKVDMKGKNLSMNRSMIVREALTHWLDHRNQQEGLEGEGTAFSSYIYDIHETRVVEEISLVKHDYEQEIGSTLNAHFSHHERFEINICKGDLGRIKEMIDRLRGIKELKSLSVNYFQ
ncbi:MAG: CopG family ribbon-helix-helix protein [Candidatus Kariarchaeaceae archaeon]|jgi:metal-responsive CopG/Arc/MetJ family transcriptional regulator